jgi:hypothetical protein
MCVSRLRGPSPASGSRRAATGAGRDPQTCRQTVMDRDHRVCRSRAADLAFLTRSHGPQHPGVPWGKAQRRSRTEEARGSNPLTSTPISAGQSVASVERAALTAPCGRATAASGSRSPAGKALRDQPTRLWPPTMTTQRSRRLHPELRIRRPARQARLEATLARADGQLFADTARRPDQDPSDRVLPAAPTPSTKSPVQTPRTQDARTPTPDTGRPGPGHRTADAWTPHTRTVHRTPDTWTRPSTQTERPRHGRHPDNILDTTTTRLPAGCRTVDLRTAPATLGDDDRLGDGEVPASARLPTALPGARSIAPSAKPRLGALLSSDDYGSRVERDGGLHPLCTWS